VTGGAGFIGSHLVTALLARGDRVLVLDDESTGSRDNLAHVTENDRLTFRHDALDDTQRLREGVAQADQVYHLAAAVGVALVAQRPIETIERNIAPTSRLLNVLRERLEAGQSCPRLFLASTSEVYGKNPKPRWSEDDDLVLGATTSARWSYGASKAIDEFLALAHWRQHRLPVVVGRFFNVVGRRQSGQYGMVLPRFIESAARGEPLVVHDDGQQTRCFAHVTDVVTAVTALMDCEAALGQVFNIGSDQTISIRELAEKVAAAAPPPPPAIRFQSYAEAYDGDFQDVRRRAPDLTRLREMIDFCPKWTLDGTIAQLMEAALRAQPRES